MLRILVAIIISLLLNPYSAWAGFFEEKDTVAQETGCSECDSNVVNLNPDLKEKVAEINKNISNSFNKEENARKKEVTLFIDLTNSSSKVAVKTLVKFREDNPGWKVKAVIVGNKENLKEKLLQKQEFFSNGIEFNIDLNGSLAREFGIQSTPAFVITYNGKNHKITGFVDLNDEISKLNK